MSGPSAGGGGGDGTRFGEAVHRPGPLSERYVTPEIEVLLWVAHSLTGGRTEGDDLVQDTLIRTYRGIDRFEGRSLPPTWMLDVPIGTVMSRLHRARTRTEHPQVPLNCHELGATLQRYLDGDIDAYRARRIQAHLHRCRRCGMAVGRLPSHQGDARRPPGTGPSKVGATVAAVRPAARPQRASTANMTSTHAAVDPQELLP